MEICLVSHICDGEEHVIKSFRSMGSAVAYVMRNYDGPRNQDINVIEMEYGTYYYYYLGDLKYVIRELKLEY